MIPLEIMAAGFASGWMLLWAASGAIPIAIHFLTRRRHTNVQWAAMQLLLEVIEKEARRVRLEQLLLLLLRISILVVLAVALAQPFVQNRDSSPSALAARAPRLWILGIDTSYSMGYRDGDVSRFQVTQEKAIEIIQSSMEGDSFMVLELSDPCRPLIERPTFDRERALAEIRKLKVADTGCDIPSCLQTLQAILTDIRPPTANTPKEVAAILLSDLGRDSWESVTSGDGARQLKELSGQISLKIVSLASSEIDNLAITSFRPSADRAMRGRDLEITLRVDNFGESAIQQVPVQLAVDGQTVESKFINVGARTSETVLFSFVPQTTGFAVLTASIPNDLLAADNAREYVIEVFDQNRLLFVEDRAREARLLRMSLAPSQSLGTEENLRTISSIDLSTVDLGQWDAVVLSDLSGMDSQWWTKLHEFVRAGGGLIGAFGPHTSPDVWNQLSTDVDLLGFQFQSPSAEDNWSIDALEYQSPVVAPFAGFPDSGLLTTPIFRYWQIRLSASSRPIVDVALANGDPLILRNKVGRGWVASVLSAPESGIDTASHNSWNAIAAWPSFVPLMGQLTQTVLSAPGEQHNRNAGQALEGRIPASLGAAAVTIIKPDGTETRILADEMQVATSLPWRFSDTRMRGTYRARDPRGNLWPYSVNVNPVESDLESIATSRLPLLPQSDLLASDAPRSSDQSTPQNDSLSRLLLCVLLGLLLTESSLAWWIGRRVG